MLNDHSKVAIAQITFYVPAVVIAAYLLFVRHRRPRLGWYLLFMFSMIRVAGGIVTILLENDQTNVGLTIATVILLGVGLMPLILATLGLIRIVLATDFRDRPELQHLVVLTRILFLIAVGLLAGGGSLIGNYQTASSVDTGIKLLKAGYCVVALIVIVLIAFQARLWARKSSLSAISLTVLKGTALAIPFLIVRVVYGFLSVFDSSDPDWSELYGSIAAFVVMALVMEYIIVVCYLGVGLLIPPIRYRKGGKGDTRIFF